MIAPTGALLGDTNSADAAVAGTKVTGVLGFMLIAILADEGHL